MNRSIFIIQLLTFIILNTYPQERNFFLDTWREVEYQIPESSIDLNLERSEKTDVLISFNADSVINLILPGQFGVNTTFRNGNNQLDRVPLYKSAGIGIMRFPAGSGSNKYFYDEKIPSSFRIDLNPIDGTNSNVMTPELFAQFKDSANSKATIVINYFLARYGVTDQGTREARVLQAANYAAGFVRKMNIELNAGVKYWEIGNECYGKWEEGFEIDGEVTTGKEYGEDFRVFAEAMKAVDPNIKVGVVVTREDDDWNRTVLPEVKNHADFLVVHNYFTAEKDATAENILNSIGQVNQIFNTLQTVVEKYTGKPHDYFPIALTEFNSRGPYNCTMVNGLFIAQVLGEIIKSGYGMSSLWVSEWKWSEEAQESKGFLAVDDPDQKDYTPRQSYMPYYLYKKCFGEKLIHSISDDEEVAVYASEFSNGEVGLAIINSGVTDKKLKIDLSGFGSGIDSAIGYWYEFYANSIQPGDKKFYLNGKTGNTRGGGPEQPDEVLPYKSPFSKNSSFKVRNQSVNFVVLSPAFNVAQPTITNDGPLVTITHNDPEVKIYYTTDGSNPDAHATLYYEPFQAKPGSKIKCIAFKKGTWSGIKTHTLRYNVLLIAVDDLKPDLGYYGNNIVKSPHLDRLANKGVAFKNAYCQWPVCGPSRASLMMGLTPDGTGIRNLSSQIRHENPQSISLPEYFKLNGYTTAACGKVFDPRNVDEGHDKHSWSIPYIDPSDYSYPSEYGPFVKGNAYRVQDNTATEKGPPGVEDDGYQDGQIALDALEKLQNFSDREQSFFLAVGFKKPHIPFIAPSHYWDLYKREDFILAPFQKKASGSPDYAYHTPEPIGYTDIPDLWTFDDIEKGENILDPERQKKLIHGYYACISYIDAQVGMLIDKLQELGMAKNTVILLYGDHGYHLGDHNQWGKHTQFENALKAPLIIYAPGGDSSNISNPVEFTDIFPTLCELAGLDLPDQPLQGKSLAYALQNKKLTAKNIAVSEYRSGGGAGYSFRTSRYRLTLWMNKSDNRPDVMQWGKNNIKDIELYDYGNDPLETVNLAYSADYTQVLDSLTDVAGQWWGEQYEFFHQQKEILSLPFVEYFDNYQANSTIQDGAWFSSHSFWLGFSTTSPIPINITANMGYGLNNGMAMKVEIPAHTIKNEIGLSTVQLDSLNLNTFIISYYAKTDVNGEGKVKVGIQENLEYQNSVTSEYKEFFDTVSLRNGNITLYFNNSDELDFHNIWIDNLKISPLIAELNSSIDTFLKEHKASFYPNPVADKVYFFNQIEPKQVKVYDINGKLIIDCNYVTNSLSVSHLVSGYYLMQIDFKNASFPIVQNFIKL